jgi:N-acetylneuraminic acid mutarotase
VVLLEFFILFIALPLLLVTSSAVADEWKQLPSLPGELGLSGSFAGVSNGVLLVAGGTNFPGKMPWEGGAKAWYDTVYMLERPGGEWKVLGKLSSGLGYGVSAIQQGGLICAGGSDGQRHLRDVVRLERHDGRLRTIKMPSMPKAVANACGAIVGNTLYVAGGIERPEATRATADAWALDLESTKYEWREIEPMPGSGRMLSVAAAVGDAFYVVSGAELSAGSDGKPVRRYLKTGFRNRPREGWKPIADAPRPVVAAPSPAPADAVGFYVLGGDDGTQVDRAPDAHRGFGTTILRYNRATDTWTDVGKTPAPRVTTPCVLWNKMWVVPGGEIRPGVRSPEVWSWKQELNR